MDRLAPSRVGIGGCSELAPATKEGEVQENADYR